MRTVLQTPTHLPRTSGWNEEEEEVHQQRGGRPQLNGKRRSEPIDQFDLDEALVIFIQWAPGPVHFSIL